MIRIQTVTTVSRAGS